MPDELEKRKADHLRIVADKDVSHCGSTLLEDVQLIHQALPEADFTAIDTSVVFFGKRLSVPLMITAMTGGAARTGELNRELAKVAQQLGLAFAVGSQRVLLESDERLEDFAVRQYIPDSVLLGNIGGQQLIQYSPGRIAELVKMIEADGLSVHLNPAHELAQDHGDRDFRNILSGIRRLVEMLDGRLLVKETGAGLSVEALSQLKRAGVAIVDVAGAGGTSWTKVESLRAQSAETLAVGETFGDWGLPTAFCVHAARQTLGDSSTVVGAGGICTGYDAARAIACGADLVGVARVVLKTYLRGGGPAVVEMLKRITHELRCAMLLTGAASVKEMQRVPRVYTGKLREWLNAYGWAGTQGADR